MGLNMKRLTQLFTATALSMALLWSVPAASQTQNQALPDFTELVEKVGPAVVNIRTTERGRGARGGAAPEIDEDMLEFFRRFGLPIPGNPGGRDPLVHLRRESRPMFGAAEAQHAVVDDEIDRDDAGEPTRPGTRRVVPDEAAELLHDRLERRQELLGVAHGHDENRACERHRAVVGGERSVDQ